MLLLNDISVAFGSHKVLDRVSFAIGERTIAGIIGPSGGGKSVLLKVIADIQKACSGDIEVGIKERKDVSLMFQAGALFDSLSVLDNVAFPLVDGQVPISRLPYTIKEAITNKVAEILAQVGLSRAANKLPAQLSGGMRRRVSLARALVSRPKFVMLDDPTYGLDPVASSIIMDLIVKLHSDYRPTMLVVSQDLRRLLPVVDQVVALFSGQIKFSGTLDELEAQRNPEIRKFVSCRYDLPPLID